MTGRAPRLRATGIGPWLIPFGAVTVALLLRMAIAPILGPATPFMMFVLAVAVSAWWGGLWTGLLATALAAVAGIYFVLPPERSFELPTAVHQLQLALFLVVGMVVSGLAESLIRAHARTHAAERAAQEEREWFRVTLRSVGDGVIATDERGRVKLLNPAAERLTGVPAADAVGEPLEAVFRIVNEDTRELAEDPVSTVLRDGVVVGLANHTLLLGRDGVERPISDSGAPIRDERGNILGVVLVFLDDTARRKQEQERERLLAEVEAERARLADVFRQAPAFMSILGGPGHVYERENERHAQLVGHREILGKPVREALPEVEAQGIVEILDRVYRTGEPFSATDMAVRLLRTPELPPEERVLDFVYQPLHDPRGAVTGILVQGVDITERVRAEADVRRLNAELEQRVADRTAALEAINKELEAFSYSVSHDLRAPLRGVDGFAKILLQQYGPTFDPQGRHYLERIRAGTQRMGRLIDDILRLSRLSRAEIRWLPVDLGAIAHDVVEELRKASPGRDVEVVIARPMRAVGDPQLLRVVLDNLLGNAWKFTSKTEHARIEFAETTREGMRAFQVRDNGVGFDMEYADKLFAAFQRLHDASEFDGTGIGLATVQRIVSRHGGRVGAEAVPDEGATFWFTIGEAVRP